MEEVVQPYISVDINPSSVAGVCQKLARTLSEMGIEAEQSHGDDFHVSLAYVLGSCEKTVLAQIAKKIAEHKLEARVIGVEILEGQTTGYDYLALSFESENEFSVVSKEISQELTTKTFSGGFRSHLTLFRFKKGLVKKDSVESVCSCISLEEQPTICAKAISIFNSNYEKQLTVAI